MSTTRTPGPTRSSAPARTSGVAAHVLRSVGRSLFNAVTTVAIVLVVWVVFLRALDVSEFVGKGPGDVWTYLFLDEDAGENLAEVLALVRTTLLDAAIGFVAGMVAAIVLAGVMVLSRPAQSTIMPVATLLRSVPLIAMTPIITLAFGRGVVAVAIVGGIVVLFPALVNIVLGLRSTSPQMRDVVEVYGGSPFVALRKVDLPSAMPSLFAAVRISVPGAITGALIAEWLATGEGVGYGVVSAVGRAQNTLVWSLVIAITLVSLALYTLAQVVESLVLARFGSRPGRG